MSPAHFSRQFRAAYGETPYNHLMTRRIERAMALLRGGASVTDACMAVGCTSLGSFSSRFAEIVGDDGIGVSPPRAPGRRGDAVLRREDPDAPSRRPRERIEQERRSAREPPRRSVARMTIALQYTNVTVTDVDESIAFYRDALGLEVQNDVASGESPLGDARHAGAAGSGHRPLRTARRPLAGRRRCHAGTAHQGRPADARVQHRRPRRAHSRPFARPAPKCCRSPSTWAGVSATAHSATRPATWSASPRRLAA